MNSTKNKYQNIGFILFFLLLNCVGIILSHKLDLPLWLDSVGTMLGVYYYGVYAGVLCVLVNIASLCYLDSFNVVSPLISAFLIYGTSFFKNKHRFDVNSIMLFSAFVIFFSFLISLCINFIDNQQLKDNLWADSIIAFCRDNSIRLIGLPLAAFYLEFLDKLVSVFLFFISVRFIFSRTTWFKNFNKVEVMGRSGSSLKIALILFAGFMGLLNYPSDAEASVFKVVARESHPQTDFLSFSVQQTVFNQKNGLLSGNVTSIATTSDGYIWIGTYAGLLKYDGNSFHRDHGFEIIRNIKCLYADGDRLWVGTTDQGVFLVEGGRVVNQLSEKDGLLSDYVTGIAVDNNNLIYITTPSGINILNAESGSYKISQACKDGNFTSLSYGSGYIFAIDLNGIVHCFINGEESLKIKPSEHTYFTYALYAEDGYLYLSDTSNTVSRYAYDGKEFSKTASFSNGKMKGIKSMFFSSLGENIKTVFISSDSGIFFIEESEINRIETENFNGSIEQGIRDFQGNLWFASSRLGLIRFYISPVVMVPALKNQVVNCITKWKDNYIVGTDEGLKAFVSDFSEPVDFELSDYLDGVRVRDVYVDSSGYLWVCTHGRGVFRIKDEIEHFTEENGLASNKTRSVLEVSDSRVMISGASGISFFDNKQGFLDTGDILKKKLTVLCSAKGPNDDIYLGTTGNGIYVLKDYRLHRIINKKDGLNSDTILKLYPLKNKKGVIAVTGNGLCYIDDEYQVKELKNFPYFNNYDIVDLGNDKVAVTGSNGVFIAALQDLINDSNNYDTEHLDGSYGFTEPLTSNSRNFKDGKSLFLCSNSGVFILDTQNYHHKAKGFKLNIESIKVDGVEQDLRGTDKIEIPRASKKLSISPNILNFTPENPYVGVCLEGVDESYTFKRQKDLSEINYTNLAPGNYVFNMALFDSKRELTSDILRFPFSKAYAFYDSKLFIIYFVLVSCLIIAYFTFFIVKLWMQKIIDEKQHLLELAEQQIKMGDETIMTIAQALDARDPRTKSHSVRVAYYSVMIARKLGFNEKQCSNLRKIALLHDIGKIGIPDRILNKPSRLTDEEYSIMKSHVTIGADILKNFKSIDNLADGIKYHHERYDGKGYALGLKGEEIPIIGRIISVADAFDAMSANRVYRNGLDLDRIIYELKRGIGTQFDPKCAEIMLELISSGALNDYISEDKL